jgi:hypothetical protein
LVIIQPERFCFLLGKVARVVQVELLLPVVAPPVRVFRMELPVDQVPFLLLEVLWLVQTLPQEAVAAVDQSQQVVQP